jgi:ABC-type dipeptide/oligopeptide/nickel transport system permease component
MKSHSLPLPTDYTFCVILSFAAGIFLLPAKPLNRDELLKLLLDTGIVMSSTVLVFWAFLIEPLIVANKEDTLTLAITLAYPVIVANGPYILHVIDFLEYHLFYPFFILARSSMISTYCLTKDLLISSSEAIFSAGIPSP